MKHAIMITVDGFSFTGHAAISHTASGRVVEQVTCEAPPMQVLGTLEEHLVDIHDVLYIMSEYLNNTARRKHSFECGPIEVSFSPVDPERFREDLTGTTYMVKLIDTHSNVHMFDVGTGNSWVAMDYAKEALAMPVRSSVVQPVPIG